MEEANEEVTEAELINALIEARLIDVHVSLPARVTAFDKAKQTVDVVLQCNRAMPDGAGNYVSETLPKLVAIPIAYPRSQQFLVAFPLVDGDKGMVVFCERNIGSWRATGSQGDPGDLGTHTLDGAVFVPGLFDDALPAANVDGTNMVVGSDTDGPSRIEIKPTGGGNLGAGATKGIARKDDKCGNGSIQFAHTPASGTGVSPCSLIITYTPGDGSGAPGPFTDNGTVSLKEKITTASGSWNCAN